MEKQTNQSKASIKKEFTCNTCKGEFDEIHSFTQYGGSKRKQEYLKSTSYCEKCFEIKQKQIS
jgi:hypothetical protein